MGITEVPYSKFSIQDISEFAKLHVTSFESHSYLTGVTAGMQMVIQAPVYTICNEFGALHSSDAI